MCSLALGLLTILSAAPAALAWKPSTHMYLALEALEDVRDGKVTIRRVNFETGQILDDPAGEYAVDELTLRALKEYPEQFLAGVLGPDAYPDIVTGQAAIHPKCHGSRYKDAAYGSDAWLQYLWEHATDPNLPEAERLPVRAFVVGFLTHAAGDTYSHTFVNHFAGGPFDPGVNAAKHVLLESYIGERADTRRERAGPPRPYRTSIKGVENFILKTLVRAEAKSELMSMLKGNLSGDEECKGWLAGTKHALLPLSFVPLTFSRLRAALLSARPKLPGDLAAAADKWVGYIDKGLDDWGPLSEKISVALFYSDGYGKADFAEAERLLNEYNDKHMKKMLGGEFGAKLDEFEEAVENAVPGWAWKAVRKLREEIKKARKKVLKFLYRVATGGKDFDDLVDYITNPANHVDKLLTKNCNPKDGSKRKDRRGECISHEDLDKLLGVAHGIKDRSHPDFFFKPDSFAPAFNTIQMTKLLFLDRDEMNRLLRDLRATASRGLGWGQMSTQNAMLGFNTSLDGDNEWMKEEVGSRMALARYLVYDQIFKPQVGEKYGIGRYMGEKADLYRLSRCKDELTRTRKGDGLMRACDGGGVYWYPARGVRAVQPDIHAKWDALGGEAGSFGLPVTDPLWERPERADDWHQFFENGVIYRRGSAGSTLSFLKRSDPSSGPSDPAAAIRHKAESLGLGEPDASTPEPQAAPDGATWWQRFGRGYVYWTAEAGARHLSEPMRDAWTAAAAGDLGPPVTDELTAEGGDENDRYQFFARGVIYLRRDPDAVRIAYLRP